MGTRVLEARQLSDVCQITDLSSLLAMLKADWLFQLDEGQ
jgi:hypothetical protein